MIVRAVTFGSLLSIVFGQQGQVSIVGVPVVTLCEALSDLSRYNGQSIVVVGRFGYTDEGSWLSEGCENKIVTDGYTWDNVISTTYVSSQVQPPPDLLRGLNGTRNP